MYFFIGFLLLIVLCLGLYFWRRRKALKKICCMSCREKQDLLDTILEPFGYYYVCDQDLISTRNDAWQRQAGYTALFDKAALGLHMVFDALPITLITVAAPGSLNSGKANTASIPAPR